MAVEVNDFVNSKSMATPGLAGGLVMFITNAIDMQFGCGSFLPYFVLGFSFLIGVVVFKDETTVGVSKVGFYILNSFIIFAVASGTNSIGYKVTKDDPPPQEVLKPTIEAIGMNEADYMYDNLKFEFTQQRHPAAEDQSLATRKRVLNSQIVNTSATIQLVQNDLVTNQNIYKDPQAKFNTLKKINGDLADVNRLVKSDASLQNERDYQNKILTIQKDLQQLQDVLLQEKKKPIQKRTFFKAW